MATNSGKTNSPTKARLTRKYALTITLLAAVIVYLLWNVAALSPLVYPFRLFVTYIHEAGHGLAALASGGSIDEFSVSGNGSGLATTHGGSRALILPSGYLGAAFFGAVLFYLLNTHHRYARAIAILLGIWLVIFTTLYARPDQHGSYAALFVGWLGGLGLIALGWKARAEINLLLLNVLAIMTALNGVLDITLLIRHADIAMPTRSGVVRNDAAAFADAAGFLPASVWAFLWAGIALLALGAAIYYSILRPMLKNADKLLAARTEQEHKL